MDSEYLRNADLDGESFLFEGNRTGVLLFHGYRATTTEVRLLANALRPRGYTIQAPLLSGHGTTPQEFAKTPYTQWLADAEQAYTSLASRCDRVYVAGESMGALLALHLAYTHPEIPAVICYSPAIIVKKIWASLVFQYFMKYLPEGNNRDELPWKGYLVNPTRAIVQLYRIQRYINGKLSSISAPVCIFIGKKDKRIALNSGRFIIDHLNASDAEIHYYQNSPHCMILADDLPDIAKKTVRFIETHPDTQIKPN
jgi:carboxylesterase